MRPTYQRLETLDRARSHCDLRLVHEGQAVVRDSGAQVRNQCQPPAVNLITAGAIGRHARPWIAGVLKSDLNAAQQLVRRSAMFRVHAHCCGDVQIQRHACQVKAGTNHTGKLLGVQDGPLG